MRALAVAFLVGVLGASGGQRPAEIVFAANRAPELTGHIVRVGLDGRTTDLARGASVVAFGFSPDGRWVAFNRANAFYAVRLDGTGFQRLTPAVAGSDPDEGGVAWSRDSRRVLLGTPAGLYVSGPGMRARLLARHSDYFEWSPNGRLVAYEYFTLKGPNSGSHVTILDLSGRVMSREAGSKLPWRLPQPSHLLVYSPDVTRVFSPNGSFVARLSAPSARGSTLSLSRRNGTDGRVVAHLPRCTDDGGYETGLAALLFAGDSSSLVYITDCGELPADIYEIRPDGSGLRRLTDTTADEQSPVWSPDGSKIAYVRADAVGLSCKGCPTTIWLMNADGSDQHALTEPDPSGGCSFDSRPSWSPDGKEIVYSHSTCDSGGEQMVVPAAGGVPQRVAPGRSTRSTTPIPARVLHLPGVKSADWSTGGTQLALVRESGPQTPAGPGDDLFTVDADGTHLVQRTIGMGVYPDVSWR